MRKKKAKIIWNTKRFQIIQKAGKEADRHKIQIGQMEMNSNVAHLHLTMSRAILKIKGLDTPIRLDKTAKPNYMLYVKDICVYM